MNKLTGLSSCIVGALVCAVAVADQTQVSVFTAQGELITGTKATLTDADGGLLQKLPPRPDGTWTVDVNALGKYTITLYGYDAISSVDFRVASEVPDSVQLEIPGPQPQQATPPNDECDGAQLLSVPGSAAGDTSLATFTGPYPFCGTSHTAPEVWYTVVGDGTTLTASTCNQASYDTKITVYCTLCDPEDVICIAGNDDNFVEGCGLTSLVSWPSVPGQTYYIMVHGFSSNTGTFELSVTSDGIPTNEGIFCEFFPPDGACCLCDCNDPPTASCILTDEFFVLCEDFGGTFQGHDTSCFEFVADVVYSDSPALPIPDGGPPITTEIVVPETESCMVGDVNVELQILGTWIGDLLIDVISPAGTTVVLWPGVCGGTANFNATADDDGTATLCLDIANGPSDAVFYDPDVTGAPDAKLEVIEGEVSGGAWTLQIEDTFAADSHILDFWALHIACAQPNCPDSDCAGVPPIPDDDESDDESDDDGGDDVEFFKIPEPATPTRLQTGGGS